MQVGSIGKSVEGRDLVFVKLSRDVGRRSYLPKFWLDNKNALMSYMELAHMGVKGTVTDANGKYKTSTARFNKT